MSASLKNIGLVFGTFCLCFDRGWLLVHCADNRQRPWVLIQNLFCLNLIRRESAYADGNNEIFYYYSIR